MNWANLEKKSIFSRNCRKNYIPVRSVRINSRKSSRVGMICVSSLSWYSKFAAVVVRFLDEDFCAPGIFCTNLSGMGLISLLTLSFFGCDFDFFDCFLFVILELKLDFFFFFISTSAPFPVHGLFFGYEPIGRSGK